MKKFIVILLVFMSNCGYTQISSYDFRYKISPQTNTFCLINYQYISKEAFGFDFNALGFGGSNSYNVPYLKEDTLFTRTISKKKFSGDIVGLGLIYSPIIIRNRNRDFFSVFVGGNYNFGFIDDEKTSVKMISPNGLDVSFENTDDDDSKEITYHDLNYYVGCNFKIIKNASVTCKYGYSNLYWNSSRMNYAATSEKNKMFISVSCNLHLGYDKLETKNLYAIGYFPTYNERKSKQFYEYVNKKDVNGLYSIAIDNKCELNLRKESLIQIGIINSDSSQSYLFKFIINSKNNELNKNAISRITEVQYLREIAEKTNDIDLFETSISRISDIETLKTLYNFRNERQFKNIVINKITDIDFIIQEFFNVQDINIQKNMLSRITNQQTLKTLYLTKNDLDLKNVIIENILDEQFLSNEYKNIIDIRIREKLIQKIKNQSYLKQIFNIELNKSLKISISNKIIDDEFIFNEAINNKDEELVIALINNIIAQKKLIELYNLRAEIPIKKAIETKITDTNFLYDIYKTTHSQDALIRLTDLYNVNLKYLISDYKYETKSINKNVKLLFNYETNFYVLGKATIKVYIQSNIGEEFKNVKIIYNNNPFTLEDFTVKKEYIYSEEYNQGSLNGVIDKKCEINSNDFMPLELKVVTFQNQRFYLQNNCLYPNRLPTIAGTKLIFTNNMYFFVGTQLYYAEKDGYILLKESGPEFVDVVKK